MSITHHSRINQQYAYTKNQRVRHASVVPADNGNIPVVTLGLEANNKDQLDSTARAMIESGLKIRKIEVRHCEAFASILAKCPDPLLESIDREIREEEASNKDTLADLRDVKKGSGLFARVRMARRIKETEKLTKKLQALRTKCLTEIVRREVATEWE